MYPLLPQIILHPPDRRVDYPAFTVDNGSQPPITDVQRKKCIGGDLLKTFVYENRSVE